MSRKISSEDPNYINLVSSYNGMLDVFRAMGYTSEIDEANFDRTAERAAKAFQEMFKPLNEIKEEISLIMTKTFPGRSRGMVISPSSTVFSYCPHHLLPVIYRVTVAYIPIPPENGGKVIGVSKLTRIPRLLASRPILQETLASDIVDCLYTDKNNEGFEFSSFSTLGSACFVEGLHMCMACRGVRQYDSNVISSEVRGIFATKQSTRDEFINIVTNRKGML